VDKKAECSDLLRSAYRLYFTEEEYEYQEAPELCLLTEEGALYARKNTSGLVSGSMYIFCPKKDWKTVGNHLTRTYIAEVQGRKRAREEK